MPDLPFALTKDFISFAHKRECKVARTYTHSQICMICTSKCGFNMASVPLDFAKDIVPLFRWLIGFELPL